MEDAGGRESRVEILDSRALKTMTSLPNSFPVRFRLVSSLIVTITLLLNSLRLIGMFIAVSLSPIIISNIIITDINGQRIKGEEGCKKKQGDDREEGNRP